MKVTDLILPAYRQDFWARNPNWEIERITAMMSRIKEGDNILDIGAEMGDITALLAKAVGDTGRVFIAEPVEKMWPTIRTIFEANSLQTPNCFVGFFGNETKNEPVMLTRKWPECSEG